MPEALGDAAVDLALDQHRVHRAADVVGGDDPADDGRAELEVHVHLRDLGTETVGLVRDALPVGVERCRVRVVAAGPDEHAAGLILGEQREIGAGDLNQTQQVLGGELRGIARHERLARGRRLARIRRPVRVPGDQTDAVEWHVQRVGGDLGHDRVRALADLLCAAEQDVRAVAAKPDPDRRWVRQRRVADAVPHGADADAPAGRARAIAACRCDVDDRGLGAWPDPRQDGAPRGTPPAPRSR